MTPEQFKARRENRFKWPFRKMLINEVIDVTNLHGKTPKEVQCYLHAYAGKTGKRFESFIDNGKLFVRRVS